MNKTSQAKAPNCPWNLGELHCVTCVKRNLSLFSNLREDELIRLNSNKQTFYFSKGEAVFRQGLRPAGLYVLTIGKVMNTHVSEDGSTNLINLDKPVNFLGFPDFVSAPTHSYTAVAIENCSVCFIPAEDFLAVLKKNEELSLRALRFVSTLYRSYLERVNNLVGKNMRGRMASTLLYIYDLFGLSEEHNQIKIELTRSDYGSLARMNTANAIRTLSDFSKSDLICFDGHILSFKNVGALQKISLKE